MEQYWKKLQFWAGKLRLIPILSSLFPGNGFSFSVSRFISKSGEGLQESAWVGKEGLGRCSHSIWEHQALHKHWVRPHPDYPAFLLHLTGSYDYSTTDEQTLQGGLGMEPSS